ncbi:MAG: sel1 repeat family protein [Burkholderiales bacterium]|nr:sel1 repeat family protein [Burkholderiales bacterium]MBK9346684.1 sel1 repeat family protein [Burkholderiales bacterium]
MGRFAKLVLPVVALCMVGSAVVAQTFEQALQAYERKDYKTALAAFMRLAQGDEEVAVEVEAPTPSQQQKIASYRKAAEQGDAAAQFIMGLVYFDGRGVAQDDRQAEAWYRKAAAQGYTSAQVNLGLMYFFGRGVSRDDQQAVAWLRKAADKGNAYGQYGLGLVYMVGRGVPKDKELAYFWFTVAGANGHREASGKRNQLESELTAQQIAKAKAYAKNWKPS